MTPLETWAIVPFWLLGVAYGITWQAKKVVDWRD